jgi:UDPglucose 6-dehydrogenase
MDEARRLYGDHPELVLCDSPEAALEGADALVIVTEWNVFRSPDFDAIKRMLNFPAIFDGRNLYDPESIKAIGLEYFGIGRGDSVCKR